MAPGRTISPHIEQHANGTDVSKINPELERLGLVDLYNQRADTRNDRAAEFKARNGGIRMDRSTIPGAQPDEGYQPAWIPVNPDPIFKRAPKKVICIGAGFAGLTLAHKVQHEYKWEDWLDLTIYEKNHDVGGTWLENSYLNVRCDVPSHMYVFSFEPNPDWSSFYSTGGEIEEYIRNTTKKWNLDKHLKLKHKLVSAIWDEPTSQWKIELEHTKDNGQIEIVHDQCDVLINASGILNKWKYPDIPGIEQYKGKLMHSASWDHDYNFQNKQVGLIGNGSSGIQILPSLAKKVKPEGHLTAFFRSSTWITLEHAQPYLRNGKNFKYTDEEKKEFRENPKKLFEYREGMEHAFNSFFYTKISGHPLQQKSHKAAFDYMTSKLEGHPRMIEILRPDWSPGCRRVTPGEGYLETLTDPSLCTPVMDSISKFTETGIITSEQKEYKLDAVVCATGFDVSFCPRWVQKGRDGVDLQKEWKTVPEAYISVCAPHQPSYFIYMGPNCPISHGSLVPVLDWTVNYSLHWIDKMSREDIRSVEVTDDAIHEWNAYAMEFLQETVWRSNCRSWYKNGTINGRVTAIYPGSILHYKEMLEHPRPEDFRIIYNSKNRFRYTGKGMTQREVDGENCAFYLDRFHERTD